MEQGIEKRQPDAPKEDVTNQSHKLTKLSTSGSRQVESSSLNSSNFVPHKTTREQTSFIAVACRLEEMAWSARLAWALASQVSCYRKQRKSVPTVTLWTHPGFVPESCCGWHCFFCTPVPVRPCGTKDVFNGWPHPWDHHPGYCSSLSCSLRFFLLSLPPSCPSSAWICFSLFGCFPNRPLSDICFLEKLTWHCPERFTELATHGALLLGSISRDHIPLWEIQEPSCCPVYLEVKEDFYYSFIFYFCSMCVCTCTRVHIRTAACVWNRENSLQQSSLSIRYAGSGDQTQIAQVGTESSHQPSDHIFKTFTTKKKWGQKVFRLIQN